MLPDQLGRMVALRLQSRAGRGRGWGVAQGHCDGPQPGLEADAADRAAGGAVEEFLFFPGEELAQLGRFQAVARGEIVFASRAPGAKVCPGRPSS